MTFDDYQSNDTANFAQNGNGIKVLTDGLYSLLVRLFWTDLGIGSASYLAEVYFSGIDDGNYAAYNGTSVFTRTNQVTTAQVVARLAANQTISVFARQESTVTWKLGTGSFLEAVRLGDVNTDDRAF